MRVFWCGTSSQPASVGNRGRNRGIERLEAAGMAVERHVIAPGPDEVSRLAGQISPGDIVIADDVEDASALAREVVARGAGLVLDADPGPDRAALDAAARDAGVAVLAGMSPGWALAQLPTVLLAAAWVASDHHDPGASLSLLTATGHFPQEPGIFRAGFAAPPRAALTALATPARYIRDYTDLRLAHPADGVSPVMVPLARPETLEFCPTLDSPSLLPDLGCGAGWTFRDCRHGALWPQGWSEAWQPVFAALRDDGSPDAVAALAGDLARDHPADAAGDRILGYAALSAHRAGQVLWQQSAVLEARGDLRGSADDRLRAALLAVGAISIARREIPVGVSLGSRDPRIAGAWLSALGVDLGFRRGLAALS